MGDVGMNMVNFEWDILTRRKKLFEADLNQKKTDIDKIDENIDSANKIDAQEKNTILDDLICERNQKLTELEELRAGYELVLIEIEAVETKKRYESEKSRFTIESFQENPRIKKLAAEPEQYMGLEQIDIELYPLIDSDHVKKYYDDGLLAGKLNIVKRKHYYYFKHKNLISAIKYHNFGIKPQKKLIQDTSKTEKITIELPEKYIENLRSIGKDLNLSAEEIICEALVLFKEKIQYNLITEKERLLQKVKKIEERIFSMYETSDIK